MATRHVTYDSINKEFIYPEGNLKKPQGKIRKFESYQNNIKIAHDREINNPITADHVTLRFCTYNIHYFSKNNLIVKDNKKVLEEISNVDSLLKDLKTINPDVLCIQEITFGDTLFNDKDVKTELLSIGLFLVTFCNIVPSWFSVPYGNAMWISNQLKNNEQLCTKYCNLKQDYGVLPRNRDVSEYLKETKCYSKITLFDIDIYCVHLDAYSDEDEFRLKQLDVINSKITKPSIIMGDFNIKSYVKNNDSNNQALIYIRENLKWINVYDVVEKIPTITSAEMNIKDYCFFAKFDMASLKNMVKDVYVYFTDTSDHLPLVIDFDKNEFKNYTKNKTAASMIQQNKPIWGSRTKRWGQEQRNNSPSVNQKGGQIEKEQYYKQKYLKYKKRYLEFNKFN